MKPLTTQRAPRRALKSPSSSVTPITANTRTRSPSRLSQTGTQAGSQSGTQPARAVRAVTERETNGAGARGANTGARGAGGVNGGRRNGTPQPPDDGGQARTLAVAIAEIGLEHKALNVEIIDVRGKVDYSDYVVVMSGRSDRQVNALGRHIEDELKQKHKTRCLGVEGMPSGTWLLMDFSDVVVHIFHEDTRGYYDLETLWMDAARVAMSASST
jgi:ribosome-associated protein